MAAPGSAMAAANEAAVRQVLDSAQPAAFEALLTQLMSNQNDQRDAAEAIFTAAKNFPDQLVAQLVCCLRTSAKAEPREMSAILLRKVITKDDVSLWPKLSPPVQGGVKTELFKCLQDANTSKSINKKVCDTVSELAAGILEDNQWPELLPFLFQCVQQGPDPLRESALQIFGELVVYITPVLVPYLPVLREVLQQGMTGTDAMGVRVAALRAAIQLVGALEETAQAVPFQDLIPGMLQTLGAALTGGDEDAAQEALRLFVDLAETDPRFVRKHLVSVAAAMLSIAESAQLEDNTRHLAAEFLVTLAEAREQAPGMLRKLPDLVERLFRCLLDFLMDIEDEAEWHQAEREEDDDAGQGDRYSVGTECLDRLAQALGGKTVLPVAYKQLPTLLQDADWRKRHAGLVTLSQIAEGCAKQMQQQVEEVARPCLAAFVDAHPRVRWAAINCVGQMCTDLSPTLQEKTHAVTLPALIRCMEDSQNPRVQAHAAAATVNFSEGCDQAVLLPYLDALVGKLLLLLQSPKRTVQEAALTALASVADCAKDTFTKFYDAVVPYLKQILLGASAREHRTLRAKALECLSLIGMAVGKERFRADAVAVMEFLRQLQSTVVEADDPTAMYMLQAWARLCKCLGAEFLPYMEVVMPPLLLTAQLKPDVVVRDADDDEGAEEEDDDVETIALGDKLISIRTSVLEEKATACQMLCCYAEELREGFLPWVETVTGIMVPLLKFYFHEEVRRSAVVILPELFHSGKAAVGKGLKDGAWLSGLLAAIWNPLLEALAKEPEPDIASHMLSVLAEVAEAAGEILAPKMMEDLTAGLQHQLTVSTDRRQQRQERTRTEDFDEEERELLEEENRAEDELFDQIQECVSSLLKAFKERYIPYLDQLMPHVLPMLAAPSSELRRIAICIFDDVMEHASATGATVKYFDAFYPSVIAAVGDADVDLRQAAAYGLGVCAQHCRERFRQKAPEALAALGAAAQAPGARSEENEAATDNVVSALGKAVEFHPDLPGAPVILEGLLAYLPMRGDTLEAMAVHDQLLRFLEAGDPRVLGAQNERLPRVVSVLAQCLVEQGKQKVLSDGAPARVRALLGALQGKAPEVMAQAWAACSAEQQQALQACMQGA